jgi:outer membrane receptor protein involved in Fe transport
MEIGRIEEQIVVTATRTEAAVSQVGNSVSVITGEELPGGTVTMDEHSGRSRE